MSTIEAEVLRKRMLAAHRRAMLGQDGSQGQQAYDAIASRATDRVASVMTTGLVVGGSIVTVGALLGIGYYVVRRRRRKR